MKEYEIQLKLKDSEGNEFQGERFYILPIIQDRDVLKQRVDELLGNDKVLVDYKIIDYDVKNF